VRGQLFGSVLDILSGGSDDQKAVPAPQRPFPWENDPEYKSQLVPEEKAPAEQSSPLPSSPKSKSKSGSKIKGFLKNILK
jgi:hypothetical protein